MASKRVATSLCIFHGARRRAIELLEGLFGFIPVGDSRQSENERFWSGIGWEGGDDIGAQAKLSLGDRICSDLSQRQSWDLLFRRHKIALPLQ
jgi:hypothetical protein